MENQKHYTKPQWTPPGRSADNVITDPYGSYTGRPVDPQDRPVQDADDL